MVTTPLKSFTNISEGSIVRMITSDRGLVALSDDAEWDVLKNACGIVKKINIAHTRDSIPWHAVSFPDLGKVIRVRADAMKLIG